MRGLEGARTTPSSGLLHLGLQAAPAKKIMSAHGAFVGTLAEDEKRKRLEEVSQDQMDACSVFRDARGVSHQFRDGLLELFFDLDENLKNLTRIYGVF